MGYARSTVRPVVMGWRSELEFARVWPVAFLALGVAACMNDRTEPAASTGAQGPTPGDWAVGKWAGLTFVDRDRTAIAAKDGYLLVEQQTDGSFRCSFSSNGSAAVALQSCRVSANAIDMVGPRGNAIHLERTAADSLSGEYRVASTKIIVNATRMP